MVRGFVGRPCSCPIAVSSRLRVPFFTPSSLSGAQDLAIEDMAISMHTDLFLHLYVSSERVIDATTPSINPLRSVSYCRQRRMLLSRPTQVVVNPPPLFVEAKGLCRPPWGPTVL